MRANILRDCLVVDDDEVSRELGVLFATEAGFAAAGATSGEEAVRMLTGRRGPHAVLADLRMPGLAGAALARILRELCGPETRLLLMSASAVPSHEREGFDAILRKPFSVAELSDALEGRLALSEATYGSLAAGMPRAQLLELYSMCLDDADRRIELMRTMTAARDRDGYERAAHAIKGGCGMVGALELAALAEAMEQNGPSEDGSVAPLDNFLVASARLRRILGASTDKLSDPRD